jgi:L-asparaginase II
MVAANTNRLDTNLMQVLPGQLIAKAGAEGVYTMGLLPCQRYPQGLGIAIKIDDGDTKRARDAATLAILHRLELLSTEQYEQLKPRYQPLIKNHRGLVVGEVRATF